MEFDACRRGLIAAVGAFAAPPLPPAGGAVAGALAVGAPAFPAGPVSGVPAGASFTMRFSRVQDAPSSPE